MVITEPRSSKISRKERRRQRDEAKTVKTNLEMRYIQALTNNQQKAIDHFWKGKHLMLHGCAGTGKSFLALYLAMQAILTDKLFEKLVIVRSVVPTRDIGFLPGNQKEKMKVYEAPYQAMFAELFNRGDAYDVLKQKGLVEFISTSFIRGTTMSNSVVLVDEIQNLTYHEADSIITRMGKKTRIMFSGDVRQPDLNKRKEMSGLADFMKVLNKMRSFETIDFEEADIVRSGLVKEYIIVRNQLEDQNIINPEGRIG